MSVPNVDMDKSVIVTGDEYPGLRIVLSGTPVGTYTNLKFHKQVILKMLQKGNIYVYLRSSIVING